ncbi:MAG: class I SAM-dependent methyltransferase [Thalassobaculum sp.]|uniref:class I SAM-dependent methyltransferase n=1 Tax=Thalassobaculum sp. TaxID=2022740 RepID=UPI0032ECDDD6
MFIIGFNFDEVIKFLPRGGVIAELGVKRGRNARKLFHELSPEKLYLVDPWAMDEDVGYAGRLTESDRSALVDYHREVLEWGKSGDRDGRVEVIRDYAIPASHQFPDKYFDIVYVDTLDSYDGFYNDLCTYAPKMKDDGIIIGDDFYDLRFRVNKGSVRKDGVGDEETSLCMINAANDFARDCGWELLVMTDEYKSIRRPPRFLAGKKDFNGVAHKVRDKLLRNAPWAIEVDDPRRVRQTMVVPKGATSPMDNLFFTRIV